MSLFASLLLIILIIVFVFTLRFFFVFFSNIRKGKFDVKALLFLIIGFIVYGIGFYLITNHAEELGIKVSCSQGALTC